MGNKDADLRKFLEESYSKMISCFPVHLWHAFPVLRSLSARMSDQRRMSFRSRIYLHIWGEEQFGLVWVARVRLPGACSDFRPSHPLSFASHFLCSKRQLPLHCCLLWIVSGHFSLIFQIQQLKLVIKLHQVWPNLWSRWCLRAWSSNSLLLLSVVSDYSHTHFVSQLHLLKLSYLKCWQ
jgi:hypothetical protein